MPPKKSTAAADGTSSTTFTDGEMKLLTAIFEGMGAEVKKSINWEGVQKKLGHAGVKTTKEKFRLLCLKYEWCEYAKDGKDDKDGSTKRSAEEEDGDAAGAGGDTDEAKGDVKKPKPRGRPPKKQKKAAEEDENDDGGVSEEGA